MPLTKNIALHKPIELSRFSTDALRSHRMADKTIHKALNSRIRFLPNVQAQTSKIVKSATNVKQGLMCPTSQALYHEAAPMLDTYATTGCPIDCGPNWSHDKIQAALKYGAHSSVKIPQALQCLIAEPNTKVKNSFAKVLKWKDIKDNPPPNLKVSPIAAIPHKSREFRMILDLSFALMLNGKPIASVNDTSDKNLAPQHAMYELGNVIPRLIWAMATSHDTTTPFLFTKVDLKDGYW